MSNLIHKIQIPFPPSTNSLWNIGNRRMFKSAKYRAWIKKCASEIIWEEKPAIDYKFNIQIVVGRPRNKDGKVTTRKMDIDNRCKSTLDSLEELNVFTNDCLVEELTARWTTDFTHTEIKIWKYEE